jgi:hypothetical protein
LLTVGDVRPSFMKDVQNGNQIVSPFPSLQIRFPRVLDRNF